MIRVNIKPMSINEAYYGRLTETKEYRKYKNDVLFLLPKNIPMPEPPYDLHLRFGFSSKSSDFDNCVKKCVDLIAKKYNFNDKLIKRAVIEVDYVKKGSEYFEFEIFTL